jgi:hypothetical protein
MACYATIRLLDKTKFVIFISEEAIARSDRVIQALSQVLICATDHCNKVDAHTGESSPSPPPRLPDRRVAYPTQPYLFHRR